MIPGCTIFYLAVDQTSSTTVVTQDVNSPLTYIHLETAD
jgi:hypothetical protein